MRIYLLYCLLFFVCASCGKGGTAPDDIHTFTDTHDDTYPVLEVTTPADNQVFTSGSTLNVTGKISDNSLFQGSITIRNDATGAIVKDQYYEIHYIPVYNFSLPYTFSVTTTTVYKVIVRFEDHGNNETVKTVLITVNP